jgi:hypothetical protein
MKSHGHLATISGDPHYNISRLFHSSILNKCWEHHAQRTCELHPKQIWRLERTSVDVNLRLRQASKRRSKQEQSATPLLCWSYVSSYFCAVSIFLLRKIITSFADRHIWDRSTHLSFNCPHTFEGISAHSLLHDIVSVILWLVFQ